ncbi:unnamed protein product [Allacma fusca]|uniref:Uncharacterized protein n=1 Tax=Allacma fusca TaxID=39272 RepID=A0A8J2KXT4_9HEXA|nr:unnamed protein product [Allacma fusca]
MKGCVKKSYEEIKSTEIYRWHFIITITGLIPPFFPILTIILIQLILCLTKPKSELPYLPSRRNSWEHRPTELNSVFKAPVAVRSSSVATQVDVGASLTEQPSSASMNVVVTSNRQSQFKNHNYYWQSKKAGLTSTDISEVVLVGGSSRIPRIQEVLVSKFASSSIAKDINADEAVARGASILASFVENPELPNVSIQECDHDLNFTIADLVYGWYLFDMPLLLSIHQQYQTVMHNLQA